MVVGFWGRNKSIYKKFSRFLGMNLELFVIMGFQGPDQSLMIKKMPRACKTQLMLRQEQVWAVAQAEHKACESWRRIDCGLVCC